MTGNIFFPEFEVALLKFQVVQTRKSAYSSGTNKAHTIQWKAYIKFALQHKFQILPVSTEILCMYARFLARSFKSSDSISNYVSGLRVLHTLLDYPTQAFTSIQYRLTIKGLTRNLQHRRAQASPVTPTMLVTFLQYLDLANPVDATCWALFVLVFYSMARKSNLVPDSVKSFDQDKQLTREKVLVGKQCLVLKWSWAKNIQYGQKIHKVPLVAIQDSPLCPVKAYLNMCSLVPAGPKQAAFSIPKGKSVVPLTYHQFQAKFRHLVKLGGWDPTKFSTHSFRRGGATCAFQAQVPAALIQVQGDWASDAYKQYINMELKQRLAVARKMGLYATAMVNKGT